MTDLLAATAELVAIASVSKQERALADHIEARLRCHPWLTVDRVGDNVVARTMQGRPSRLVLAGHLDTVPPKGNERPRTDGDVLWGIGSADMKGGLAVMADLAATMDRLNMKYGNTTLHFAAMLSAKDSAPTRISFTQIPVKYGMDYI